MAGQYMLLSAKDIRGWELFDGQDDNWPAWSFSTKAALNELGWRPVLTVIETAVDEIDMEHDIPHENDRRVSAILFSLLAQRTRGKAQTIARLLEGTGNGFECWRRLLEEYAPKGNEPGH